MSPNLLILFATPAWLGCQTAAQRVSTGRNMNSTRSPITIA